MQSADRIEFLVHTYADRITRIGYTWFGNVHDAQDVCQTVLLRLMTHDCPDDSPEAERAWVLRVTINARTSSAARGFAARSDWTRAQRSRSSCPNRETIPCSAPCRVCRSNIER